MADPKRHSGQARRLRRGGHGGAAAGRVRLLLARVLVRRAEEFCGQQAELMVVVGEIVAGAPLVVAEVRGRPVLDAEGFKVRELAGGGLVNVCC